MSCVTKIHQNTKAQQDVMLSSSVLCTAETKQAISNCPALTFMMFIQFHCILTLALMSFGGKINRSLAGRSLGMRMLSSALLQRCLILQLSKATGWVWVVFFLFYQSMLQIFMEMEIKEIIKEDDLSILKDLFQRVRADIKKKIDAYEEKKRGIFI